MRYIIAAILVLFAAPALASTVTLDSGKVIEAEKVTVNDDAVVATIEGIDITYFPEEVTAIDGEAFGDKAQVAPPSAEEAPASAPPVTAITQDDKSGIIKAYSAYRKAIAEATSFDDMKDVLSEQQFQDAQAMVADGGMGEEQVLGMIRMMSPADPEIQDVVLEDGKVVLKAAASGMMGEQQGTIEFMRSPDGVWRVVHENWNTKIDGSALFGDLTDASQ